jgi:hypothetical protein
MGLLEMPGGQIQPLQIQRALNLLEQTNSIEKYKQLQDSFRRVDVSESREFQTAFNGYYRVGRRKPDWYRCFFRMFEQAKKLASPSFRNLLEELAKRTGRVEASFVSKLVATVDPSQPVIDRILLEHAGLTMPRVGTPDRLSKCEQLHRVLKSILEEALSRASGRELIKQFDDRFPGLAGIPALKKLDLVLWQIRSD